MTARSIRRAIERKRVKDAREQQKQAAPSAVQAAKLLSEPFGQPDDPAFLSEAKTQSGAECSRHVAAYELDYQPVGQHERGLVQSIADGMWRLKRIPALEFALLAKGQLEIRKGLNATSGEEPPADLLGPISELEAYLRYEKQLRNLHLQESRLHRRYTLQVAELQKLQTERRRREQSELIQAADLYEAAEASAAPLDPAEFGFEFSIPQIKRHLALRRARKTASPSTANPNFSVHEGSRFQSQAA